MVYPRHIGKGDAEKAFAKATKATPFDIILAGTERFAKVAHAGCAHDPHRHPKIGENCYVPYPATWLNRCGWEDELPAPAPTVDLYAPY